MCTVYCLTWFRLPSLYTFRSNPAKLHLWGQKAEGNLARPFKSGGGLMEQITGQSSNPQTDAAAIKSAEKPTGSKAL